MRLELSVSEYIQLKDTIINIENSTVANVWNRIISHAVRNTTADTVIIDIKPDEAEKFLGILVRYSKPMGSLLREGFSITLLGKWKSFFKSLGETFRTEFVKW